MLTRFLGIAFTCLLFVCLEGGSQIIITSNSGKIKKFGATQALVLNFLQQEALWYFFKVLTFGSEDSKDHPKLESIARWRWLEKWVDHS
jgi:hypothetical protein